MEKLENSRLLTELENIKEEKPEENLSPMEKVRDL